MKKIINYFKCFLRFFIVILFIGCLPEEFMQIENSEVKNFDPTDFVTANSYKETDSEVKSSSYFRGTRQTWGREGQSWTRVGYCTDLAKEIGDPLQIILNQVKLDTENIIDQDPAYVSGLDKRISVSDLGSCPLYKDSVYNHDDGSNFHRTLTVADFHFFTTEDSNYTQFSYHSGKFVNLYEEVNGKRRLQNFDWLRQAVFLRRIRMVFPEASIWLGSHIHQTMFDNLRNPPQRLLPLLKKLNLDKGVNSALSGVYPSDEFNHDKHLHISFGGGNVGNVAAIKINMKTFEEDDWYTNNGAYLVENALNKKVQGKRAIIFPLANKAGAYYKYPLKCDENYNIDTVGNSWNFTCDSEFEEMTACPHEITDKGIECPYDPSSLVEPQLNYFTANGSMNIEVGTNQTVNYSWKVENADDPGYVVSSYYKIDVARCTSEANHEYPWTINKAVGAHSGIIKECQGGGTYSLFIKVENESTGYKKSFGPVIVKVKAAAITTCLAGQQLLNGQCVSCPANMYKNVVGVGACSLCQNKPENAATVSYTSQLGKTSSNCAIESFTCSTQYWSKNTGPGGDQRCIRNCGAGQSLVDDQGTVNSCQNVGYGNYSPIDNNNKYPCTGEGKYSDISNASVCKTCPTGQTHNPARTGCINIVSVMPPVLNYFTANGASELVVADGTEVTYKWSIKNATDVSSYYVVNRDNSCGHKQGVKVPWKANSVEGIQSGNSVTACQIGSVYSFYITAANSKYTVTFPPITLQIVAAAKKYLNLVKPLATFADPGLDYFISLIALRNQAKALGSAQNPYNCPDVDKPELHLQGKTICEGSNATNIYCLAMKNIGNYQWNYYLFKCE